MTEPARNLRRERAKRWIGIGASASALVATVLVVGTGQVWARLRHLDVAWLGVALAITVLQFLLLASRWWFVALRLGVPMRYRRALGEYYLSTLLNNVLPFGVMGDALRALRHADRAAEGGDERPVARVVLAMLIERASGQVALWLVALSVTPDLLRSASLTMSTGPTVRVVGAAFFVAMAAGAAWAFGRRWLPRFREAAAQGGRVLVRPASLFVHLPISLVLVGTHVALFVVAARAIGLELAFGPALHLVPPVLVAATVPALFGGFGMREAAAAGLYHLAGLRAADGATISFVYGSVALVGSLPGVLALPWRHRGAAPRTRPALSSRPDARADAAP